MVKSDQENIIKIYHNLQETKRKNTTLNILTITYLFY